MFPSFALSCDRSGLLVFDFQPQGLRPRTPGESLLTRLPLASCQRLPSGRHRTISWTVLLLGAQSDELCLPTKAPTRTDGVFRRGAATKDGGGSAAGCGGGAGAAPPRLQIENLTFPQGSGRTTTRTVMRRCDQMLITWPAHCCRTRSAPSLLLVLARLHGQDDGERRTATGC